MDVDKLIQHIPNNVSGDGKPFVAALKKALIKYKEDLNKKIDDNTSSAGEKPGHVSSVQLLELHSITDGVRINSIQVSWVKTTVTNYAKAEVWFRTATDKAWEKAGESSGTQFVYSGATTGLTYYIKVVAVNTKGNAADFDTAPQASIKIQGSQYIPNPPTQFVLTWDEKGPLWKWLFEPNEYIDFFELRLDQNPGVWNDKRLDSTRETWSRANPGVRSGTAYLYIRNIFGEYSEPAVHEFSKALPQKPTAPQLTSTIDGVRIKMQGLPLGATGYKIHIKTKDSKETVEDDFYTVNSEYIYFFFIGHITVKYCFVDPLGDGEWSDTSEADCKAGIDIGQVPTIDYTKFDKFTQDAIDKANNQPSINDAFKNLITDNTAAINEAKKLITDNTTAINEANKLIDANANGIHQNADNISSVMTKVNGLNEKVEGVEGTVTTQGTAIVQTATDITALAKRVTVNEGTISTNTSSIQQNADSIASVVKRVDNAEGTLKTHGTAIKQNADSIVTIAMDVKGNTSSIEQNAASITSVVKRVDDAEGTLKTHGTAIQQNANSISTIAMDVQGNASAIEQNAKSITAIVEDVKGNRASIQANADNITSIVTKVDKQGSQINSQGSAIVQNANSITSVVTELNKKPADCNYSSINQLQDDILLCVKKDGVINAINVSTEGIVIDGKKVHITGDTVFDNNVIVGGMIAADSIALEHLKANSVSSAKIQANAITSTKIAAGAVTADKIEAGAITAEKLAADSVTSDAIQAGSVIGDKIAANTITGKHFAAANIDLTGALTITGGNVKLSEEGLRLSNSNGSYTLFNQEGINYVDASGVIYGQVKRMLIGTAYDGSIIKFKAPWESVPLVLMTPTSLMVNNADYSQNNIYITCKPTNVSTEGFSVNCYSSLGTGTTGTVVLNKYISNYQDTSQRTQTFMEFTIVVPKSAGSMTVYGTAHNIPWNRYDNDGNPDKGVGWSNLYVELSGTGVTSTAYHYGPNKNADKSEWNADFSVSAKLNNATKVTCKVYGSWTDTNNYNSSYTSTGGITISIPNVVFDVAGETIVSRGYANFIVIDSASNMYSVEAPTLTTKVLVQYNGSALINTAITVNGESKTTDTDGYITLSATITTETEIAYEFTYNSITVTKGVKYENGAQNIVNITSS